MSPGKGQVKPFWPRVKKTVGCWLWLGRVDQDGYGLCCRDGHDRRAHRVAWIELYGPIPAGLCVCHTCDTPGCVRPSHLFLATQAENRRDCVLKGRHSTGDNHGSHKHPERFRGENNARSKLTEDAVAEMRELARQGMKRSDLAQAFGIGWSQTDRIVRGLAWKHLREEDE
jgi:hypothetical protein